MTVVVNTAIVHNKDNLLHYEVTKMDTEFKMEWVSPRVGIVYYWITQKNCQCRTLLTYQQYQQQNKSNLHHYRYYLD